MKSLIVLLASVWAFFTTPIPNPFAYWFQNEFAPLMPRKWKRMLYVSSIIAMTSMADRPDFRLFERINEILKMTYRPKDYWIPKFIRNMIWKSVVKQRVIVLDQHRFDVTKLDAHRVEEQQIEALSQYLSDHAPEWIVYAPEYVLRSDAKKCLSVIMRSERSFSAQTA